MIFQPGILTGPLSGHAGSTAATANHFASIIKAHHPRRARNSSHAQAQRANFAALSKIFGELSPTQLTGWSVLGSELDFIGALSRQYTLTAAAAFMSVNRNLFKIGRTPLSDAPSLSSPATPAAFTAAAFSAPPSSSSLTITIAHTAVPADTAWALFAMKTSPASVLKPRSRTWKLIKVLEPGDGDTIDCLAAYDARFPEFTKGQQVWFKLQAVTFTGFVSDSRTASCIATGL